MLALDLNKTAAQRGLLSSQLVQHFVEDSTEALFASTATLSHASGLDTTASDRRVHSHDLLCTEESDQVVIGVLKF